MLTDMTANKPYSSEERALAIKYRMVKFFERRKLLRKIKRAENDLKACAADDVSKHESLTDLVTKLKGDLSYIVHYPKNEKYISLFRDTGDTDSKSTKTRGEIRRSIMEVEELS